MSRMEQGFLAEEVALSILLKEGFIPIMRNFRLNRIQIDIIAIKNLSELYFLEIKQVQSNYINSRFSKIEKQLLNYQTIINFFQETFGYEIDCFLGYIILDENFFYYLWRYRIFFLIHFKIFL